MAKKQTRRSISVSGDTYNAVRDYCDEHNLSASGLVTDLLNQYLVDNADGPPPASSPEETSVPETIEEKAEKPGREPEETPQVSSVRLEPPQPAGDVRYPDRRGPGFGPLPKRSKMASWLVTAQLEISRKRQIDAHGAVETLLHNLVHRRMVNRAHIVKVEQVTKD